MSLTRIAGMYANVAGRDASRGMAKQSFDEGACLRHNAVLPELTERTEMLTPIDQPLDKLEDLKSDEMCVSHSSRPFL